MSRRADSAISVTALMLLGVCSTGCSFVRNPQAITRETHREHSAFAAFLSEGQQIPAHVGGVDLKLPVRIGLTFLPPAGDISDPMPAADQRRTALTDVREAMLAQPFVSEVAIIPDYYLDQGAAGGFEKLHELSRRFDFDLLAVLCTDQTSYETRNFRSLGLITVIGADLWDGDVDEAVTVIELAIVEPTLRAVVMRVSSAAMFGDSTTLLDDWRSNKHVRRVSFDEARVALIDDLRQQLVDFQSRLESPSGQRP